MKLHELAATCTAVLRPSRPTWERFVENLRRLREDAALSDDETVAIVASELTDPILARIDEDLDPDADTIGEAIDRVRAEYRKEGENIAHTALAQARSEVVLARQAAQDALDARVALEDSVEHRIRRIARMGSRSLFLLGTLLVMAAAVLSFPGVLDSVAGWLQWVARGVVALAALLGVVSTLHGVTIGGLAATLEAWLSERLRSALVGNPAIERPQLTSPSEEAEPQSLPEPKSLP